MIDAAACGKALFDLAHAQMCDARLREELGAVCTLLRQTPEYITLMDTPAVPTAQKRELLRRAFGDCDKYLQNFLCILAENRAMYALFDCCAAFDAAFDEAHEILRATVESAVPLTREQTQALTRRLHEMTGKTVVTENRVNEALLGGVRLRYGGVQLDDTLRGRLERLRERLEETTV